MNFNGNKILSDTELSEYQKKIESIDNVILCVAEAERMLIKIGKSLVPEPRQLEEDNKKLKYGKLQWLDHTNQHSSK
jgi:hypothetical protein